MAEAARKLDDYPADALAPPVSSWSGEVHGPVAALHQAIEQGLAGSRPDAWSPPVEPPVDRALRLASRVVGWGVLAASFAGVATLIF